MKSKTLSLRLLLSFAVMFAALTTVRSASAQQETVFFNFDNGGPNSGSVPYSALISDSAGNFYGTEYGGSSSAGLVYELSPAAGGGWTQEILHSFTLNAPMAICRSAASFLTGRGISTAPHVPVATAPTKAGRCSS